MEEEFTLANLDTATVAGILRRAYLDHSVGDEYVTVEGDFLYTVLVEPEQDLLRLRTIFGTQAPFLDVLSFANRFSREMSLAKCFVPDDRDEDGDWRVVFEWDHWVMPGGTITAERLVRMVREFEDMVGGGIRAHDPDDVVFPSGDETDTTE
jgi:hypothetical protein